MNAWPNSLPLPAIDAQGSPRHATLASSIENSVLQRRNRFRSYTTDFGAQWVFDDIEFYLFEEFFETTVNMGVALFSIELRYPKTSELTEWVVRFAEGYEADYNDGLWTVTASLVLIRGPLPEIAPLIGLVPFYVQSEIPGEPIPFVVTTDNPYHVRQG